MVAVETLCHAKLWRPWGTLRSFCLPLHGPQAWCWGPLIILLSLLPQKPQCSMPSQVSLAPRKTPTSFSTACRLVCVGGTFLDLVELWCTFAPAASL